MKRVIQSPAFNRSIIALLAMVVFVGLGERMAERFLPLYLLALGGGTIAIGLLNGMQNLLNAIYSYPGGYLSDRFGYKKALMIFNLVSVVGYAIVIIFPSWQAAIVGAALFLTWSALSLPAVMELVSTVLPKNRRTFGVSLHSMIRRVPMALGPVLGGALIEAYGEARGIRYAFGVAMILGLAALIVQQKMIHQVPQVANDDGRTRRPSLSLITAPLRNLLVSDILIRFCEQIPYAFVVVWCVRMNGITPVEFGVLTTIEMLTAMAVYLPVAYLADRGAKKPFVTTTFVFFTLFPLLLLFSHSFWVLVFAFFIRGMKEFGEATRKALIMDLSPDGRKAATFGMYYLVRDVIVSIAAFGGAFLWDATSAELVFNTIGFGHSLLPFITSIASPTANLLTAFTFGAIGTVAFAIWGTDLGHGVKE
jgi:MFS family permease